MQNNGGNFNSNNRVLRRTIRTVANSFIEAFFPSTGDYISNYYRGCRNDNDKAISFIAKLMAFLILK